METKNKMLYSMIILAAISVIIFSLVGIATMTGHIPAAQSKTDPLGTESLKESDVKGMGVKESPATVKEKAPARRHMLAQSERRICNNCGVVESIRATQVKGDATGLGAVAGGLGGALLGNQIGNGNGRTIAMVAGMAGGAYAGNEVEKNVRKTTNYRIRIRMEDGSFRTVYQRSEPGLEVGERVRIVNGAVVTRG